MHDAAMLAEDLALEVDDVAAAGRIGPQPRDQVGVAAGRNEADVLAVGLVGDREAEATREVARFGLGQLAKGKAQKIELRLCGGVEEVALVAVTLAGAIQGTAGFVARDET